MDVGCKKLEFKKPKQLLDLKSMCFNDTGCIAVSCEETKDDDECSRAMLSNSCDDTTIDPQSGWTIHLMKTGLYFLDTKNCYKIFCSYTDNILQHGF